VTMSVAEKVSAAVVRLVDAVPAPVASSFRSSSLAARAARPLLNRLLPAQTTEVAVRSGPAQGIRLVVLPRREKYYWTGAYERELQDALVRLLRPGMAVWDVGAHIGFFSLLAARLVGREGVVHAFEPMSANRARLEAGLALNAGAGVVVHDRAVSATPGRAELHAHEHTTMWSLLETGRQGQPVEVVTLDQLAGELGAPQLVKIDVEGAEVDVLRGGERLLGGEARPALLVEFTDERALAAAHELLPEYGFEPLGGNHWLLR
jgi:FkbM family methyltransferase